MASDGELQKERERSDAAEEESVKPLLARANLLRMRRQWDDAITACTEALRRAPRSASAHAMLGNIYESQGKSEDAIEWYVMAQEIRPLSPADAAQLEHLLDIQRVRLRTDELSTTIPLEPKARAEKTLEWFDRVFPPGRSDGLTRMILAMGAGIALVIAICAALIYFYVSPRRDEAQADAAQMNASDSLVAPTPIVMTPSVSKASAVTEGNPLPVPSASPSIASSKNAPDAALADVRTKVAESLEGGSASVSGLSVPADSNNIALDITLTGVKGESGDHLRERTVRIAGLAARATALSAPETLQKVLLRLGVDAGGLPLIAAASNATPVVRSGATVIFVGTAVLRSFRDSNVEGLPTSDLLARFESTQWYSILGSNSPVSASAPTSPVASTPAASPTPPASVVGAGASASAAPSATPATNATPSPTPNSTPE